MKGVQTGDAAPGTKARSSLLSARVRLRPRATVPDGAPEPGLICRAHGLLQGFSPFDRGSLWRP